MSGAIIHGGGITAAAALHGGRVEDWLDLSTGINPCPPDLPAIEPRAWHRLPDRYLVERAQAAAAGYYGSGPVMPLAVPGTQSVIQLLPRLVSPAAPAAILSPTYGEYARAFTLAGHPVDAVATYLARLRHQPTLRFLDRFPTADAYIDALHRAVRTHWDRAGKPDRLLLSFHGLPQQSVRQGDPYFRDCQQTARALRERLGEDGGRLHVAFQSRFGAAPWLQPYTQPTLEAWGREGVGTVDLMCPGFLADCLETLEEIDMGCREAFLAAGGKAFRYIPCLNADPDWARDFAGLIADNLGGWT